MGRKSKAWSQLERLSSRMRGKRFARTEAHRQIAPLATLPSATVSLQDSWSAVLTRRARGAHLSIRHASDGSSLEISILLTDAGPVIRAQAAALEIESQGDLVARCERFRLEARESLELVSAGSIRAQGRRVDLQATHGSARVVANDDVQLLGEQVLLNCERAVPVPPWALPIPQVPAPTLPIEPVSGDATFVEDVAAKG